MGPEEKIRFRTGGGWLFVEVLTVEWDSHVPREVWHEHLRLPVATSLDDSQRREIASAIMADPKWFRTCSDCGTVDVAGMFTDHVCHGCAQKRGVVF